MTTSEIAKLLGISRGTVSRVINGYPNVNAETRKRVLAALEENAYKPNEAARSLVMQRKWRIAVVVFSEPRFFWEQVHAGVNAAAAQLAVHGVTAEYIVTDILKPEEQVKFLHSLSEHGYDAVALAPNDVRLLGDAIDALSESGIPVLLMNVDIPEAKRLCFVGCDDEQAGTLAGELLCRTKPAPGETAVIALKDSVVSIERRVAGFRRMLTQVEGNEPRHILRLSRMAEGAYEQLSELLRLHPQVTGVYVAIGALEQAAKAVIDSGLQGKVTLIGHDFSAEIYRYLCAGAITATVGLEPYNQGYYAVKLLHNYLKTQIPPTHSSFYCKLEAIFQSNARYYLNQAEQLERLNL